MMLQVVCTSTMHAAHIPMVHASTVCHAAGMSSAPDVRPIEGRCQDSGRLKRQLLNDGAAHLWRRRGGLH
jgi:hypothetical protein